MTAARGKLYRPAKLEKVEVAWEDAQHDTEFDGDPSGYSAGLAMTRDVGYFVSMGRRVLVLASCRDDDGGVRWLINIPTVLVRSIRSLEYKEEVKA